MFKFFRKKPQPPLVAPSFPPMKIDDLCDIITKLHAMVGHETQHYKDGRIANTVNYAINRLEHNKQVQRDSITCKLSPDEIEFIKNNGVR